MSINILDENDNRPIFTRGIYAGTIEENALVGTHVTMVRSLLLLSLLYIQNCHQHHKSCVAFCGKGKSKLNIKKKFLSHLQLTFSRYCEKVFVLF